MGETFVLLCIYLTNTGSLAGLAVLNGTHIIIIIIIVSVFRDNILLLFPCLICQSLSSLRGRAQESGSHPGKLAGRYRLGALPSLNPVSTELPVCP